MKKVETWKSVYLIGIKGVAMSGLAKMAKEAGYQVTGSDLAESFPTDSVLRQSKIEVLEGFDGERLRLIRPDLVVVSAAYDAKNPEVKAAKAAKIPIISQSEMLGRLMAPFEGVGVAGVHGKTTTTALLAYLLTKAGFSPSYAIGSGSVPGLDGNAHIGEGKIFLAEADEYRRSDSNPAPKFFDLPLRHLIITSIELDHPDLYESAEAMYEVFYRLASKIPRNGTILAC
ncbi:MAG: Mur ligase domain-containing protein, partial [Patescibacteria group bacterium]